MSPARDTRNSPLGKSERAISTLASTGSPKLGIFRGLVTEMFSRERLVRVTPNNSPNSGTSSGRILIYNIKHVLTVVEYLRLNE